MTDPYTILGERLISAAHQQHSDHRGARSMRPRLATRLNLAVAAGVLTLAGGAIAVAATGLLNGSPVSEPQGTPTANAGTGVPAGGGSQLLALRAADPEGGLPWGMRLVRTTRGETCVQIGRVQDGQLGQLGIDGAFNNDSRFHPMAADILPNFTDGYANMTCLLPGEIMIGYAPTQDRNAEWGVGREHAKVPAQQLRSISWGLLGAHAVSVTYRTGAGSQTVAVSPGSGAFMIVGPVKRADHPTIGGFIGGRISGHEVSDMFPLAGRLSGVVSAATYRFGALRCSVGSIPAGATRCPALRATPMSAYEPTRSLHERVDVTPVQQSRGSCDAAYLLYPCYRAQLTFKAPYAVTSAASEYEVLTESSCHNATPSDWPIDHDIKQGEVVRSQSLGLFNCMTDGFELRYINQSGASAAAPHESVIVGIGVIGKPPKSILRFEPHIHRAPRGHRAHPQR